MRGFTLLELLVTISMMSIISGALFGMRGISERKLALDRSANKLAQDLRLLEERAMGSVQDYSCSNGKELCGFGVYFETSPLANKKYYPFLDCSTTCTDHDYKYTSEDVVFTPVALEKDVTVFQVSPLASPPDKPLSLVFVAPDPLVYINNQEWGQEAVITLQFEDGETRKVKVNSTGRVEIER